MRLGIQALPVRQLDHLAQVHNGHAVGDVLNDGKVVRDEQIRGAVLILQVLEQVEHLGLNGYVQSGDGLVADDELGAKDERTCDAHTLTLAAGELMRVAVDMLRIETDDIEQLSNALDALLGRTDTVDHHGLGDDLADGHTRIEGRVGILEDELHVAAHGLELFLVHLGNVFALEVHLAGGRRIEIHDGAASGGLAATGLAYQTKGLAGVDLERDVVNSGHDTLLELTVLKRGAGGKLLAQMLDLEQRGLVGSHYASPPLDSSAEGIALGTVPRERDVSGAYLPTNSSSSA